MSDATPESGSLRDPQSRPALLAPHEEWVLAVGGRERGVLLDVMGNVVTRKEGEADSVHWTVQALRPLIGKVYLILHNHPRLTSLSPEDLMLAMNIGAKEVVAITPQVRFCLSRPGAAWPPREPLSAAIAREERYVAKHMRSLRDQGRFTDDDVDRTFYHACRVAASSDFL